MPSGPGISRVKRVGVNERSEFPRFFLQSLLSYVSIINPYKQSYARKPIKRTMACLWPFLDHQGDAEERHRIDLKNWSFEEDQDRDRLMPNLRLRRHAFGPFI